MSLNSNPNPDAQTPESELSLKQRHLKSYSEIVIEYLNSKFFIGGWYNFDSHLKTKGHKALEKVWKEGKKKKQQMKK